MRISITIDYLTASEFKLLFGDMDDPRDPGSVRIGAAETFHVDRDMKVDDVYVGANDTIRVTLTD